MLHCKTLLLVQVYDFNVAHADAVLGSAELDLSRLSVGQVHTLALLISCNKFTTSKGVLHLRVNIEVSFS